jgi:8-oxo-dGTP pyrophosphatase MutT (NUDIX family)
MNDQQRPAWRILSSSYPIATPFLRLRSDIVELPNGSVIEEYYVRETRGFAVIFALTPEDDVILVRQYKHGAQRSVLELPAGSIDPGETAAACAVRELAEETGYLGDPPELVGTYLADPTNSDGSFHLFLIRNAVQSLAQSLDVTEDIAVERAALSGLRSLVRGGDIVTGSHVASVYATLEHLGLLPA